MRIFQRKKSEAGFRHDRLKQRLDADIDHLLQGKELAVKRITKDE